MRTFLDDRPLAASGASLGAALTAARAAAPERLVVAATADGTPVPETHLAAPPEAEPYAGELRLVTADPRELLAGALREAAARLREARPAQRRVAEHLQVGETKDAMTALGPVLGSWEHAAKVVVLGREADPGAPETAADIAALFGHLRALKQAIERQDLVEVAYTLDGDLDDALKRWLDVLGSWAERV